MKKIVLVLFAFFIGFNVFGQRSRSMNNRIPQTNREPSKQDIEKRDRMVKERKDEFIANFLTTLDADDFQKEIIKQYLNSFYDAKIAVLKTPYEHSFDREQAVKKLEDIHFADLKELISEADMAKIKKMITGRFNEKEAVKEKKKKKKKKKKKNQDKDKD
jgi:hypothetical protein